MLKQKYESEGTQMYGLTSSILESGVMFDCYNKEQNKLDKILDASKTLKDKGVWKQLNRKPN